MNHAQLVHQYLKTHGKATAAQIYAALGIWRVSSAIKYLRKKVRVKTTMIAVKNRRKESVRVALYSLGR